MRYNVGSNLIRSLVMDSDNDYTISVSDNYIENSERGCIVSFNPELKKEWVVYENGVTIKKERPAYISLAHEMVHLYREKNFYKSRQLKYRNWEKGFYRFTDVHGKQQTASAFRNELETVGINYIYKDVGGKTNWFISNVLYYTENNIRLEHNLPIRVYY